MKWLVLGTLCALWARWPAGRERRTVAGPVRGALSPDGRYEQFLAVPYGYTDEEHRFQAPLPVPKWDGILNAVDEHIRCPQRTLGGFYGQENCLTLNVYTPIPESEELLPVMVNIHGGGFFEGSGSQSVFGPEYLIDKGIILVSINYRLNIQGYLCLGIKEAPGNAGMKDQVAALRWVQENIREFGGNPDDVTIFGESAGAASVSFHLLSPMSKGLFHKAILQSGSSIAPWAIQYDPVNMASLLAKQMGYNTKDALELYNIFKNKSNADLILTRVPRKDGYTIMSEILYSPCVEENIPGVESFLTEHPYDLLSRGEFMKIPLIIGSTSEEGLLFVAMENATTLPRITLEKALPRDLVFPTDIERKVTANKIERMYFGDEGISTKDLEKLSKIYGEPYFNYPAALETELILKQNTNLVFNYNFAYNGYLNTPKRISGFAKTPGATHADDLFYLFKPKLFFTPYRFLEGEMIQRMTTLWTNFAKFSDPTPEVTDLLPVKWNPTDPASPQLLVIDEEFTTEPLWSKQSLLLWKEIYSKYRRKH